MTYSERFSMQLLTFFFQCASNYSHKHTSVAVISFFSWKIIVDSYKIIKIGFAFPFLIEIIKTLHLIYPSQLIKFGGYSYNNNNNNNGRKKTLLNLLPFPKDNTSHITIIMPNKITRKPNQILKKSTNIQLQTDIQRWR